MSTKVTKFSDLLSSKASFTPLTSPPTPSSQFETLSSTEESSEPESPSIEAQSSDAGSSSKPPYPSPILQGASSALKPGNNDPSLSGTSDEGGSELKVESSELSSSSTSDKESSEVSTELTQNPFSADPTKPSSSLSSKIDGTQTTARRPVLKSLATSEKSPSKNLPATLADRSGDVPRKDGDPSEASVDDNRLKAELDPGQGVRETELAPAQQDGPALTSSPPPSASGETALLAAAREGWSSNAPPPAGSIFNLQGLEEAFPMQPSEQDHFAVVSSSKALHEAAKLGVKLTAEGLSKPKASHLPDGSLLLTAPMKAVSMVRVAGPCAAALASASKNPERLLQPLRIVRQFDLAARNPRSLEELAKALQTFVGDDVLSCSPSFSADVDAALSMLAKVSTAIGQQTSAELMYLKRVNEFRAMKSDLRALSEVLKADGARVSKTREKADELMQRKGPALTGRLENIEQTLLRLERMYKDL